MSQLGNTEVAAWRAALHAAELRAADAERELRAARLTFGEQSVHLRAFERRVEGAYLQCAIARAGTQIARDPGRFATMRDAWAHAADQVRVTRPEDPHLELLRKRLVRDRAAIDAFLESGR